MIQNDLPGLDVSRETIDRLVLFAELAKKWTARINLIAPSTVNDIWLRHIVDSAQLYQYAPDHFETWVDLGSGGGFPGIVLAAIAHEKQPDARFTLIESDQRKSTFLRTAARELGLAAQILTSRIESAPDQAADVLSARALTALENLLPMIALHRKPSGIAVLHKGKSWQEEIQHARKKWSFEVADHPSMTDGEARILTIHRIERV